jgi:CRP-like cAMP-binding protein
LDNYLKTIEEFLIDLPAEHRAKLLDSFSIRTLPIGSYLSNQGERDVNEYILLRGRARSLVTDAEGNEANLNLYVAPIVITPNMARTSGGSSLVDIEVLDDAVIAIIPAAQLMDLMVKFESIREWGNTLMRQELTRKVGREWCLAVLNALQRLEWFRKHHPGYEDLFAHFHIASYLGMTPVTLSRARNR